MCNESYKTGHYARIWKPEVSDGRTVQSTSKCTTFRAWGVKVFFKQSSINVQIALANWARNVRGDRVYLVVLCAAMKVSAQPMTSLPARRAIAISICSHWQHHDGTVSKCVWKPKERGTAWLSLSAMYRIVHTIWYQNILCSRERDNTHIGYIALNLE